MKRLYFWRDLYYKIFRRGEWIPYRTYTTRNPVMMTMLENGSLIFGTRNELLIYFYFRKQYMDLLQNYWMNNWRF